MKNKFRIVSTTLILCSFLNAQAQDSTLSLRKEFYLSFAGFSPLNVSLKYKKQIRPKTYFKIGLVSLSANYSEYNNNANGATFPVSNSHYSGGLEVGIEFRREVTKKLTFFHGPSIRGIYEYRINRNLNPSFSPGQQKFQSDFYSAGIPYALGILCQVYGNFHVAAEINPAIYCTYQRTSATSSGYNFNAGIAFDNRYGLFSLVYRY